MPWVLAKDEAKKKRLGSVVKQPCGGFTYNNVLVEKRYAEDRAADKKQLGLAGSGFSSFDSTKRKAKIEGIKVAKGNAIFPRFDVSADLEGAGKNEIGAPKERKEKKERETGRGEITIDDFKKIKLKTAKVTGCVEPRRFR
jgi:methionyl-tRNA synthetase